MNEQTQKEQEYKERILNTRIDIAVLRMETRKLKKETCDLISKKRTDLVKLALGAVAFYGIFAYIRKE